MAVVTHDQLGLSPLCGKFVRDRIDSDRTPEFGGRLSFPGSGFSERWGL